MKKTMLLILFLLLVLVLPAWADMTLNIKLNFFGPAAGGKSGAGVTTSVYLKSMVQRNLQVPFSTADLKAELQKTFNVPGISLLAEGDLVWRSGGESSVMQIVQIDGREIALVLTPLPKPGVVNFKVGVVEESNKNNVKNILLDTEIVLPDGEVAMLGFRDMQENSYFIAFCVQGREDKINKDVLKIAASQKPKKINEVKPVYPAKALEKKIQGVVTLEATIDTKGQVINIQAISSPDPFLTESAVAAIRQWIYEPYIVNGQAKVVAFTVTVTFKLTDEPETKIANNALTRLESAQRPRKIMDAKPVYPPAALEKKLQGVVILECIADEAGKVIDLRMVKSPDPILTDAAIQAVKQWVYEPYVIKGKAQKVIFTVTVTFTLKDE